MLAISQAGTSKKDQFMQSHAIVPVEEGYFLGPQSVTKNGFALTWPRHEDRWPFPLPQIQQAVANLIHQLMDHGPVTLFATEDQITTAKFACGPMVTTVPLTYQGDMIGADGPWHLTDGVDGVRELHWTNNIHGVLHAPQNRKDYVLPLNLDGQVIMGDGKGLVIASEEGLLDADRNPELTIQQIEERLALYLGARHVVWLGGGLHRQRGGLTGGILPGRENDILVAHVSDHDLNRSRLDDMAATLAHDRNAQKEPLNVVWIECDKGAGFGMPLDCIVMEDRVLAAMPSKPVEDYFGNPVVHLLLDDVLIETGGLTGWVRALP